MQFSPWIRVREGHRPRSPNSSPQSAASLGSLGSWLPSRDGPPVVPSPSP